MLVVRLLNKHQIKFSSIVLLYEEYLQMVIGEFTRVNPETMIRKTIFDQYGTQIKFKLEIQNEAAKIVANVILIKLKNGK